jgi:septum formation protein
VDDWILGKPKDREDAFKMLSALSGKSHQVISGVCLKSKKKKVSFATTTNVHFKKLSTEEIDYYIDNYKPFDKAGAYGIQEWIGFIGINGIEGSYFNVVGLPIQKLYEELSKF